MAVTVTKFDPTSKIKNGKDGLANTPGSKCHVRITGTNLADGSVVSVYYPAGSTTLVWTGTTYGANNQQTRCRAKLTDQSTVTAVKGSLGDGDTAVGVTVGDSTRQTFNVQTGPPLDGSYAVACNGTGGGGYKWLTPSGTTGVCLSNASTGPSWVFSMLNNQQGNCYTIQCDAGGSTHFLQWSNSGAGTNVGLTTTAGAGTGWLLDSNFIKAVDIPSNDPGTPNWTFLNGNTQDGAANICELQDPNDGTSWTLGTFGSVLRA